MVYFDSCYATHIQATREYSLILVVDEKELCNQEENLLLQHNQPMAGSSSQGIHKGELLVNDNSQDTDVEGLSINGNIFCLTRSLLSIYILDQL